MRFARKVRNVGLVRLKPQGRVTSGTCKSSEVMCQTQCAVKDENGNERERTVADLQQ